METFVDTALAFPTVVFTVLLVVSLGVWLVSTVFGAGFDALDIDLPGDVDADVDVDGGEGGGLLRGAFDLLGITGMPVMLGLVLVSLTGWVASMLVMGTVFSDVDGLTLVVVGVAVLIASLVVASLVTGVVNRRYSHVFVPTLAMRNRDLVGRVCTVTTQRVSATFGQAEVRDDEGGSLLVQVRCQADNDLTAGDRVLIYDLESADGTFMVSPDRSIVP